MTIVFLCLGGILVTCGAIACVIPVLPGPLLSFCGLLCMTATAKGPLVGMLLAFKLLACLAMIICYIRCL